MQNDFVPAANHRFKLGTSWGHIDCQVKTIEPNKTLSYSWDALGLVSVVTWTLSPTGSGTHLRMEQKGFRADQKQAFHGARAGWSKFSANLEQVLAQAD